MVKVFSKGRLLAAVMIALSMLHTVVVWLSSYSRGDCDDKAVHYYSSSYVLAAASARAAVLDTLPAWLEKLPASRK